MDSVYSGQSIQTNRGERKEERLPWSPLKFYHPKNKKDVSHYLLNYQNNFSVNTDFTYVDSINLKTLLEEECLTINQIPLVKFDIEGAEIEVIENMLELNLLPKQILVEFDLLYANSFKSFFSILKIDKLLRMNNYYLIKNDGRADFLYYKF